MNYTTRRCSLTYLRYQTGNIAPMLKQFKNVLLFAVLALALLWQSGAHAALLKATSSEDLFLAAHDAARAGDKAKLAKILPQLQGYVLLPYVEAWNMKLHFDEIPNDTISAWLENERGNYLADRVRADWLKWLGAHQQWDRFDIEYPKLVNEDLEITCYAIASRTRHDASAVSDARAIWKTAKDLPDSCTPLMTDLIARGVIGSDDIWARVRLALEAGNVGVAERVARSLPAAEIPESKAMDRIAKKPQAWLDKPPPSLANRPARELTLFALNRLARADPQLADSYWEHKLRERFPDADQNYGWQRLGYHAARHHDPDALKFYARAGDAPLTDDLLAWKVRAALRAHNWGVVASSIDQMPAPLARDPAWIYWHARALKALGKDAIARTQFTQIGKDFSFYGQLASEELGTLPKLPPVSPAASVDAMAAVANITAFKRARTLYQLGLRGEGAREWQWGIRDMDDKQLLAAAALANLEQLYDRAINTAEKTQTQHDFTLRYLMPFSDVLVDQTNSLGLDTAWVYGLIRQESRFVFDAKSVVGARGLMQLMPATAKWVAKRIGMGTEHLRDVNRADINIVLGTNYLKQVQDDLGSPVLASAGYNAGPGRARRWRDTFALEGAIYAETIPLDETRDYVKKVMSNAAWYATLMTKEPQSLKARLGMIQPRATGESFNEDLP
jgi:soluble lytic murein transglycosylase